MLVMNSMDVDIDGDTDGDMAGGIVILMDNPPLFNFMQYARIEISMVTDILVL